MALNIKIDFKNRYTILSSKTLEYGIFESELVNGQNVQIGIKISSEEHPLMPEVFNLAFGPVDELYRINDKAKLAHLNYSKVFSTIVFEGLSFLTAHPDKFLGIDGSNMARAYMYYRCIQNNFSYLSNYFVIYGINYYMRIFRNNNTRHGMEDFITVPKIIEKGEIIVPEKLYNYFIFKMKSSIVYME